jgi:hypothetical protein
MKNQPKLLSCDVESQNLNLVSLIASSYFNYHTEMVGLSELIYVNNIYIKNMTQK